ncbi:MAG: MlaD family protein [Planctomycetota bacterium]
MAWPPSSKNNIIAGLFLFGSMVAAVLIAIVLGGLQIEPMKAYTARFDLITGASGVQPGSSVTVAGVPSGRVTGVEFETGDQGRVSSVLVSFRLAERIPMAQDARVELVVPIVGTISSLNVIDTGTGTAAKPSDRLTGSLAGSTLLAGVGIGNEQREQIQSTIAAIDATVTDAQGILDAFGPRAESIADNAEQVTSDIATVTGSIVDAYPAWQDSIDTTLDDAATVARDFREVAPKFQEAGISLTDLIQRNESRIENLIVDATETAERVRKDWVPLGTETLTNARDATGRVDETIAAERENLRAILANVRLVSGQARLAMQEIRAAPWRLLYRPDTKELTEQLLYDATRSFATAAADLRAAAVALDAAPPESVEELAGLRDSVQRAVEELDAAEDELSKRLGLPARTREGTKSAGDDTEGVSGN